MRRMKTLLAAALLLLPMAAVRAQEAAAPPEPVVQRQVSEDDNVRIEEVRVRGQTQSITVKNKIRGLKGTQYEIVPPSGARDPSQAGNSNGQRVWHLLSF
jgi:hypothetical protein